MAKTTLLPADTVKRAMTGLVASRVTDVTNRRPRLSETKPIPAFVQCFLASIPQGVATDATGHVYEGDTCNNRIQKFTSDGSFLCKWGSTGTGPGEFTSPIGVAIDEAGNVFVADSDNHRIQVFRPSA